MEYIIGDTFLMIIIMQCAYVPTSELWTGNWNSLDIFRRIWAFLPAILKAACSFLKNVDPVWFVQLEQTELYVSVFHLFSVATFPVWSKISRSVWLNFQMWIQGFTFMR